jgi:hypothetical protein
MTAIPKPWMELMNQQGISSIRQLAKAAGFTGHTVVNAVIMRGASTSQENMEKIATALRVPVENLYGITSGVNARPLSMPAGTEKLSERQKNAVAEIIRTMIEEKENDPKFVDKKSGNPSEPVQEKTETRPGTAKEEYELAARRELFERPSRTRAKPAEKRE